MIIIIKTYSLPIMMFYSLAANYKMLSSNNQCIYSQYKIYVEKYYRLKKMIKELRFQNKAMQKELKELKQELLKDNDCDVTIQINDTFIQEDYLCERVEDNSITDSEEVEDKFELV